MKTLPNLNPQNEVEKISNLLAWIEELEKTDLPQTTSKLYDGKGYCCWGIFCLMVGRKDIPQYYCTTPRDVDISVYDYIPKRVGFNIVSRYGIMNDNRASFKEIAKAIREDFHL